MKVVLLLRAEVPTPVFFYHPDHLGTSTVISNSAGAVHQYFFNLPFGETMIEGCTNTSYELNYKFNAKELDAESGLYYYGARYYDPRISVWMSVDPMAEKYRSFSPYAYCGNNPIIYIDPDGMRRTKFGVTESGDVRQIGPSDSNPDKLYAINENGSIRKNVELITINDKKILPSLASDDTKYSEPMYPDPSATVTKTYNPKTKKWSEKVNRTMLPVYYGKSTSKQEAKKVFTFCASNSSKEWGLSGFKNGDWLVGTLREDAQAPDFSSINSNYTLINRIWRAHSHGGDDVNSDFMPSQLDISNARRNPNTPSYLYTPQNPKQKWLPLR